MSRAWLTPDDLPNTLACARVFFPDGEEYAAALRGAIHLLAQAWNWEWYGTQSPEDVAQLWAVAEYETFKWEKCMPIGTVILGGWASAPEGFLLCDGSSYNTTDYADLFAEIGYSFGGSGSSFKVPDMRDAFPVGANGGSISLGATGGESQHTLTTSEMPAHTHSLNEQVQPIGGNIVLPVLAYNPVATLQTNSAGGGNPHNNMPPYVGLNAAISYR